jgi:hypothetical protein
MIAIFLEIIAIAFVCQNFDVVSIRKVVANDVLRSLKLTGTSITEGMETDLHDMIGSYQYADLIPKMLVSKIEHD